MAWDDPVVWLIIAGIVVLLFGASRIPQFAKSIGQARREFTNGWNGTSSVSAADANDPLIVAAQREGIDTSGKTREQIASEISWKLNKK